MMRKTARIIIVKAARNGGMKLIIARFVMRLAMSEIHQLKTRRKTIPTQGGVTQVEAGEIHKQFHQDRRGAPSITVGGHSCDTIIDVLEGKLWPGVRRVWLDRCWPCGGQK